MKIISDTQPYCRWCAKPLQKLAVDHYFSYPNSLNSSRMVYHPETPKSRDEAKRFSNHEMIAIRYNKDGSVYRATFWDGESYYARYEFFCKIACAASLGQSVVPKGWASQDYFDKMREIEDTDG